jgi:hypothetical protein
MQVTVDIPDSVAVKAAALGLSVEQYVSDVLVREITTPSVARPMTPEESTAWLTRLAQFSDQIPELPDEALTRQSFYQDHD